MEKDTYKCAKCGGVFTNGRTDEIAVDEMKELWGDIPEEDRVVVCDDCYKKIDPKNNLDKAREYGYKK